MKGEKDLRDRTKGSHLRVIRLVASLPCESSSRCAWADRCSERDEYLGRTIGKPQRARSKAEFISKIGIVEQEADETLYWLES